MTVYDRREDGESRQGGRGLSTGKSPGRPPTEKEKRGKAENRPKVLARLPNLDIEELDKIVEAEPQAGAKRPLGQKISTAVLIAVGMLFLGVAIRPYLSRTERGLQPPAPSAPSAPAWDATAAKDSPSLAPSKQAQSIPPVPVSIPALPTSIPAVPDSIQGPANGSTGPTGMPVPSFNKHSQIPSCEGPAQPVVQTAMAPAVPATAPPGVMVAAPPAAPPAATVVPAPGTAAGVAEASQSAAAVGVPSYEPGVARLQGVIESTQRPSYDPSRSSLR